MRRKTLLLVLGLAVALVSASVIYLKLEPLSREVPGTLANSTPAPSSSGDAARTGSDSAAAAKSTPPVGASALPAPEPDLASQVRAIAASTPDPRVRAQAENLLLGEEEKRVDAIRELGFSDDPRWVAVVIRVLAGDPSAPVRSAAAAALAPQSSIPRAAHALSEALTDADSGVRQDALLSLKAIRTSTVEQDLRRQLAAHRLDEDTAREARVFLDRYYVHKDPLAGPLGE